MSEWLVLAGAGFLILLIIGLVVMFALRGKQGGAQAAPRANAANRPSGPPSTAASPNKPAAGPKPSSAAAGSKAHWLVGVSPLNLKDKAWHIGERTVTLGRGTGNFVQVVDEAVSRIQCQFAPDGRGLKVVDKAGHSNTFVNGAPIGEHLLTEGDVLRVGGCEFVYRAFGEFGANQGLDRRQVGLQTAKETKLGGMQTVPQMLEAALRDNHGDLDQAAESLGMKQDFFLQMLKANNINPADFQE